MTKETVIVTAMILLAAPFAATMAGANADDNATWGLCQADENNDEGDNASNGTVGDTAPFANTSEEDCANAEHPANGTPGEDHAPDDTPDEDDNPGDDAPDEDDNPGDDRPDEDDNPGDDEGDNDDDNPDEDDNPGDDRP